MKRAIHGWALAALLVSFSSGCQSLGTATIRGQSPAEPPMAAATPAEGVTPAGYYHKPIRAGLSEVHDHYQQHHSTSVTHFQTTGSGEVGGPGCPPGGYGQGYPANCPPGYEQGYPADCPPGYGHGGRHGRHHGGHYGLNICPQDVHSYDYIVPNNLVYPQPNAVGGAVVYPYYTHRGPSDFFRQ